jgi:hypothetical protein
MRRELVPIALCFALLLGAPARADDPKEAARQHFERGNQLLSENAVEAALAEFRHSHELYRTRGNTQNMAVVLNKLGRYDEALETYQLLLKEFALETEERQKVEREIQILKGLVGKLIIVTEPGARVSVDGRERGVAPLPGPISVAAGARTLRIVKAGRIPFEQRIEIAGGQERRVEAELPAAVDPVAPKPEQKPERAPAPPAVADPPGAPFLAALAGPALGTGLGGPLAEHCTDNCDPSLALGFSLAARGGWHFGSGVEVGVELGYLQIGSEYSGREDFIEVQGSGEQRGTADDRVTFRGFSVGAYAGYAQPSTLVLRFGLGAGVTIARVLDDRTGSYPVQPGVGAPYDAEIDVEQTRPGTFGYLLPEVFLGVRAMDQLEIGGALGVLSLIALSPARYKRDDGVLVTNAENGRDLAYFRTDELTASPLFLLLPRVGVFGRL